MPFEINDPVTYQVGLNDWSARTTGRYDIIYVSGSADWYLGNEYVAELGTALSAALEERAGSGPSRGGGEPSVFRSSGPEKFRAVIKVAK
jgi:hypothetical protein